jgi:hypothetical protein
VVGVVEAENSSANFLCDEVDVDVGVDVGVAAGFGPLTTCSGARGGDISNESGTRERLLGSFRFFVYFLGNCPLSDSVQYGRQGEVNNM